MQTIQNNYISIECNNKFLESLTVKQRIEILYSFTIESLYKNILYIVGKETILEWNKIKFWKTILTITEKK